MARSGNSAKKNTNTVVARGKKAGKAAGAPAPLRANADQAEEYQELEPMLDDSVNRDAIGVVLAVIAVASFIAVIAPTSAPVTAAVSNFFHLGFGLGAYVLPLALLAISALVFLRDRVFVSFRTWSGLVVIFVAVCTILSLLVPGSQESSSVMFEPLNLSSAGGYLGATIASALQGALGKTIALVVSFGIVLLGMVVIGFSVSSFLRGAAHKAEEIARKRRVDVNDNPWGGSLQDDESLLADDGAPRQARGSVQSRLFDLDGQAETTFLGSRSTTVLPRVEDDGDEVEESSPFVDLSDQIGEDQARTRLLPVKYKIGRVKKKMRRDQDGAADAPAESVETVSDSIVDDTPDSDAPTTLQHAALPAFLQPDRARKENVDHSRKEDGGDPETLDAEEGERKLPPVSMLHRNAKKSGSPYSSKELEQTAAALQSTLAEFGLHSRVVGWISGPTVTTFKVQPGEGERVSRISNLEDDIALSLATDSVRIFAPIPGTSLVGIEIPNRSRENVSFGDILPYVKGGPLEFALGRDAEGTPMVADLAKMPHLLIAGTTGSGKSVVISSILMSLLMRTFPEDVRLIMIDPKRVEFAPYDGLPHLYVPVVTEPKQAASALQWAVSEMERRLKIFERIGVRKIATFNEKQQAGEFDHYDNPPSKMPYLVIVIDELSDLMMVAGKDVEASIVRIAQLGRAAGIHMIVATQRPSSNVVTGLIKANITNRIGLTVATGIDSRVILDQTGAEKLLGQGDMLFSRVDWGKPKRIQGCYVSDEEIVDVVGFVKEQCAAEYHEEILSAVAPAPVGGGGGGMTMPGDVQEDDPLLWDAARIVVDSQLGSTSGLQRRLKVGYARAGRIMDMLEEKGIVGPPDGSKPREVLLDAEGLAELESLEARMAEEDGFGGL